MARQRLRSSIVIYGITLKYAHPQVLEIPEANRYTEPEINRKSGLCNRGAGRYGRTRGHHANGHGVSGKNPTQGSAL